MAVWHKYNIKTQILHNWFNRRSIATIRSSIFRTFSHSFSKGFISTFVWGVVTIAVIISLKIGDLCLRFGRGNSWLGKRSAKSKWRISPDQNFSKWEQSRGIGNTALFFISTIWDYLSRFFQSRPRVPREMYIRHSCERDNNSARRWFPARRPWWSSNCPQFTYSLSIMSTFIHKFH